MSYTISSIDQIPLKKSCTICKNDMKELGTAGESRVVTITSAVFNEDGSIKTAAKTKTLFRRRHDWFCNKCNKRQDKANCECDKGSCLGSNFHHGTKHECLKCGESLACDQAHGLDVMPCGHEKPVLIKHTDNLKSNK